MVLEANLVVLKAMVTCLSISGSKMAKEKRERIFYQVAGVLQTFQTATDFMLNS